MVRHYFVTGLVQGVGFRNYTQKKAKRLGICGWVRNLQDGRVEAIAKGSENDLESLEVFLRRGPELAQVQVVDIEDLNADEAEKVAGAPLGEGFDIVG